MKNGRILHLAINEKFIDHAYISFENVAPGLNDFFIFFDEYHSYIKQTPYTAVRARDRLGLSLYKKIAAYDLVVVHSLHPFWISVINGCRQDVTFVWVGWGYDYYDLLYPDKQSMLLPLTAQEFAQPAIAKNSKKRHLPGLLQHWLEKIRLNPDKQAAIEKIALFSPVLPNEYPLIQAAFQGAQFPAQVQWNYGSLEEVLLKGFIDRQICGKNILLGNSASASCNHLDILSWLSTSAALKAQQVICPLSYGDSRYAASIKQAGMQLLPGNFQPLTDFMPLSQYLDLVSSCSHLIMNHVRQQGVGNILIMLYLGAMVFLREENPCYDYFRQQGFVLYSVQQLQQQPELLQQQLSETARQNNRSLLFGIWSKQVLDRRTAELISRARALSQTDRTATAEVALRQPDKSTEPRR